MVTYMVTYHGYLLWLITWLILWLMMVNYKVIWLFIWSISPVMTTYMKPWLIIWLIAVNKPDYGVTKGYNHELIQLPFWVTTNWKISQINGEISRARFFFG